MEAVEAITRVQNIITSFANLDISEEVIASKFSEEAGKIAKVQIVGSGDTVKAVTIIMSSIGEASLKLMLNRIPLVKRKNLIAINQIERDKSQVEIENYLTVMKNLNLQGNAEERIWSNINKSFDYENDQIKKYNIKMESLREIQIKEHNEYSKMCMNIFFEISVLLPDAVLAVRNELDLEIAPEEYLNIYNDHIKLGKKMFSEFIEQVPNT